ncbi:MAG: hypothetical protein J0L66_10185 [Cytophagales bacterium]|nr:hypothetical protein [Cytophagales bacterium]
MGLFSLFKSSKPVYTDRVWRTTEYALQGMITDALVAITRKQVPVVICFFEDELQQITKFLAGKGVPAMALRDYSMQPQEGVVLYASATNEFPLALANQTVAIFLFGHYPLPKKENEYLQKIKKIVPSASLVFYSSLDEPAFKMFSGERLIGILDKLGMKEDEAIEHPIVTRSMQQAREKVERMVRNEIPATSEEGWFLKNINSK